MEADKYLHQLQIQQKETAKYISIVLKKLTWITSTHMPRESWQNKYLNRKKKKSFVCKYNKLLS